MAGRILNGRARNRGQRTHKTSVFGIMGGTINSGNYRNSIRSATQKATNYNKIPPRPDDGYNYMLNNDLLSKNPQCSGGVGRMHTHPGACGPCNCTVSKGTTSDKNGGGESSGIPDYFVNNSNETGEKQYQDILYVIPTISGSYIRSRFKFDESSALSIDTKQDWESLDAGMVTFPEKNTVEIWQNGLYFRINVFSWTGGGTTTPTYKKQILGVLIPPSFTGGNWGFTFINTHNTGFYKGTLAIDEANIVTHFITTYNRPWPMESDNIPGSEMGEWSSPAIESAIFIRTE